VRTYDRKSGEQKTFSNSECGFEYRSSLFKKEKDRYVILDVTFQLERGEMSLPIKYAELAKALNVYIEDRVLIEQARAAVLSLRALKGMLLDAKDHDTWSAGSFFVNPIVSTESAAKVPDDAPRWPQSDGRVKTSAAWLMERSGVKRGDCHEGAGVSTKHVLALVNNGNAKAADIIELARASRSAVKDKFGITLEPEVQFVGLSL
jgi:UDP-N-acetylmuramate dehydrogenase